MKKMDFDSLMDNTSCMFCVFYKAYAQTLKQARSRGFIMDRREFGPNIHCLEHPVDRMFH